ncbi:unnamed protein product [Dicrocoelium dendriticum]|nr:unnamed protein product [Dicrocoelium dendriticum]
MHAEPRVITENASIRYTFSDFYDMALHLKLSRKSYCIPTSVSIRPARDTSAQHPACRIYFVSYPRSENPARFTPTLFCCDACRSSPGDAELTWFPLVPEDFGSDRQPVSLAESLLRERMRSSANGVADIRVSDSGRLVLTASSRIFSASDSSEINGSLELLDPVESPVSGPLQPRLCPFNDRLIACVTNGQLTVGDADTNTWVQLTHGSSESGISFGMPSYVVQEEFDRYVGFWWQPTTSTASVTPQGRRVYRILYEVVDERAVQLVHLLSGQTTEAHRYPKAGTANATSDLRVCEFELTDRGEIASIRHLALPSTLFHYLPGGFEYLVRAGWTPDGEYVWCQLMPRSQGRLELILIPLSHFTSFSPPIDADPHTKPRSPCIRLLIESEPELWVNVHNFLEFLQQPLRLPGADDDAGGLSQSTYDQLTFIWASHRSGYCHLYLMQRVWPKCGLVGQVGSDSSTTFLLDAEEVLTAQLTNGPWEVTGKRIWLDESHHLVYFEANREHPLLHHIYAVSYEATTRGKLTRLTPFDPPDSPSHPDKHCDMLASSAVGDTTSLLDPVFLAHHDHREYPLSYSLSAFDPKSGWAVLSSSNLGLTTGVQVVLITCPPPGSTHSSSALTALTHVTWLRRHMPYTDTLPAGLRICKPPVVVRFDVSQSEEPPGVLLPGDIPRSTELTSPDNRRPKNTTHPSTLLYGLLYVPDGIPPPGGFPTIHFVYGGPGVQLVQGCYSKVMLMHALLYCHFGYALFFCDCRGSANRGIEFAGYIKNRLGVVELHDHVHFLRHVAWNTGLINLDRVAITGYSYGGYLSLMAAMRYHHVYRAAIAGSPVVDWIFYDTAYTERYLGLPMDNPNSYWSGNVVRYVDQMPADIVRLLICHGGQDENVHFEHTARLLQKLETGGKPFKLLYYPTSRHGIKEYEHLEASVLLHLESVLQPDRSNC